MHGVYICICTLMYICTYTHIYLYTHTHKYMHALGIDLTISSSLRKVIKRVLLTYIKRDNSAYQGHSINEQEK